MVTVLVAAVATIALAGYLFPSGLAADYAVMSGRPNTMFSDKMAATLSEYARYDADSVDSRVQTAVVGALMFTSGQQDTIVYQTKGDTHMVFVKVRWFWCGHPSRGRRMYLILVFWQVVS